MKIYRHERKYLISEATARLIEHKLVRLLKKDRNQIGNSYRIRSLYFDDAYYSSYRENDAGVDDRKKIRIRVYDDPRHLIRLEIKYKLKSKVYKESCVLKEELFWQMLNCNLRFSESFPKALRLFYLETMLYNLRPTVIVEYERSTFVSRIGNVRVTVDRNIAYSTDFHSFLDKEIALTPLLPAGQHVLEVKYDELLPELIAQTIETGELSQTTFSKFYLSFMAAKGEHQI